MSVKHNIQTPLLTIESVLDHLSVNIEDQDDALKAAKTALERVYELVEQIEN
jgi:hypothetical protein